MVGKEYITARQQEVQCTTSPLSILLLMDI